MLTSKVLNIGLISLAICFSSCKQEGADLPSMKAELTQRFGTIREKVIRPAEGYLKHEYLIPAGFYKQMWDWDGYFMGYYWLNNGRPDLLQSWALNLMEGIDERGYVCGCATVNGPKVMHGSFSMKPFLSQGIVLASEALGDWSWVEPWYEKTCRALAFRDSTQYDANYGLYFWENGFQSGADNNVALNYYAGDTRSFLAADCSTMQLREFKAQARIAKELGRSEDAKYYAKRADELSAAINKHRWCAEDACYYNIDRSTGAFYKRVSYSSFWPLFESLASKSDGQKMLRRHMFNPKEMQSPYGFRTLSASDPDYNNKNIIKPFSNWQGPVWIIANYIYSVCLYNYGFADKARWQCEKLAPLVLEDLREYNTTHECWSAETGEPLSPAFTYTDSDGRFIGFISWNLLLELMMDSATGGPKYLMEIRY